MIKHYSLISMNHLWLILAQRLGAGGNGYPLLKQTERKCLFMEKKNYVDCVGQKVWLDFIQV